MIYVIIVNFIVVYFMSMIFTCQLGEFGRVYKGLWTKITAEKEKASELVAVKTIKSM